MQPPNRNGRTGNNPLSMNGGFPAFPDPFAGFGGFGGRPGGFLSDMLDNDPFFSDPFFSRAFGAPFGGGIFAPSGIFNPGVFGMGQEQMNPRGWSQQQGQGSFIDERPYTSPAVKRGKKLKTHDRAKGSRQGNRRNIPIEGSSRRGGVKIEELPEDHNVVDGGQPNLSQEPIVEHPEDDDERTALTETFGYQPRSDQLASSRSQRQPQSAYNPVRTYSFQSSSVVYGGNNGQYYSSQTTRRQGPNGVIEEEHQEKDTTTGRATHRVSHGLNDKGRSLTRKRNAEGREQKLETLHNLEEDEVQDFERTWETLADKSLPKWNKSASQRLGSGSSSQALPALPAGGSSRSNRR